MARLESVITQVDREVMVTLLLIGHNTPGNIADISDRHRNSVQDSLQRLEENDLVLNKGSGVYALTFQGATMARSVVLEYSGKESSQTYITHLLEYLDDLGED